MFQRENWLLDPEHYWVKVGEVSWAELAGLADPVAPLWIDGHNTYNGSNDKIPLELTESLDSSLTLVHIDEVELRVFPPGETFGDTKRKVQARFDHAGVSYALWVTDPIHERRFLAEPNGNYSLGECFITVSLGEPYKGDTYKLVATIIERVQR